MMSRMSSAHDIVTLMEWTGRTNRSKFRQAVLAPLLTLGLVEMTVPDKPPPAANSATAPQRLAWLFKRIKQMQVCDTSAIWHLGK
jgi:hypothetical protein